MSFQFFTSKLTFSLADCIIHKADPDPDRDTDQDLQKKRAQEFQKRWAQNSLYGSKIIFDKVEGADFKYGNRFLSMEKLPSNKYPKTHFCSCTKFCNYTNSLVLISNMTIVFYKYDNSFSKLQSKNTQIRHFWFQFLAFSFLHETLQLGKFEGTDFKYDKFRRFHFCRRHCHQTESRTSLISKLTIAFRSCTPKHINKTFLIPSLKIFNFGPNFAIRQISQCSKSLV